MEAYFAVTVNYTVALKTKSKKANLSSGSRPAPNNRKLTKERVASAMESLRRAGDVITTKALLDASGGKGSYSTLIRLRKEIEAERPELVQSLGVSRSAVVSYIESCDRADLPALEEAMRKRKWVIRFSRDLLVLELYENAEASTVLEALGAQDRGEIGWSLSPTLYNYHRARQAGFTDKVEAATIKQLNGLADRAHGRHLAVPL